MFQRLERIREVMTREELVKQKAQEFTSSGEFSPTLTECFITGAEWEHNRFMEKACKWLRKNTTWECNFYGGTNPNKNKIEDFRKAMEE